MTPATKPAVLTEWENDPATSRLADFSYAGYRTGSCLPPRAAGPVFDVRDFGVVPDDGKDHVADIQAAIDAAADAGGGVVFFPMGRYEFDLHEPMQFLRIRDDNIVLRGEGSGCFHTLFYDHRPSRTPEEGKLWLAGLRPGFVHVGKHPAQQERWSPETHTALTALAPAPARTTKVRLTDPSTVSVGQTCLLTQHDPDTSLVAALARPSRQWAENRAATEGVSSYKVRQLVRILAIDGDVATLDAPIRWELRDEWSPTLWQVDIVRNIGIENIRFRSAWKGPFDHHGSDIDDNGWDHLRFEWCEDCWVRNVVHDAATTAVSLTDAKNCLLYDCRIEGPQGHNGWVVTEASTNNLLMNLDGHVAFHTFNLQTAASGNVFLHCRASEPGSIDCHGGLSLDNLFDDLQGCVSRNGGAGSNIPPAHGRGFTLWNWQFGHMEPYDNRPWETLQTATHFPGLIAVGCRGRYGQYGAFRDEQGRDVAEDLDADWAVIESFGRAVQPTSLYEYQRTRRLGGPLPQLPKEPSPPNV